MLQLTEELVLDRLIHEPGRLAILTVLSSVTDADFLFLQRATGLTKGNLSSHLTSSRTRGSWPSRSASCARSPTRSSR